VNLFVKICGITRQQDAELAADLGASAVGFVFWPGSPRYVDIAIAKAIAAATPGRVAKVGVFVDQTADDIVRIMDEVGLDIAQLHGHESAAFCREVLDRITTEPGAMSGRGVIKAVAAGNGVEVDDFDPDMLVLVDAYDPARLGGTGKTANWDSARAIAARRRTILAGGLNAANIKLAIRSVRPYGIDVSSGVESAPGIKEPNRLRSFFEALHD
jgi:phosphoribosylanthranilate isomerase